MCQEPCWAQGACPEDSVTGVGAANSGGPGGGGRPTTADPPTPLTCGLLTSDVEVTAA